MKLTKNGSHSHIGRNSVDDLLYNVEILKMVVNSSEAGVYVSDYHTGEILFANQKTADFIGGHSTPEELIGQTCWKALNRDNETRCEFCAYKKLLGENGELLAPYSWERYFVEYGAWAKITNQAIRWVDGRIAQITTFHDITETKNMQGRLFDLAFIDQLTHIKNRFKFEQDMLEAEITPSIIIFDILSLQRVNDAYGRKMGDNLLKAVCHWVFDQGIPGCELYRIGSDEFCLTVGQATSDTIRTITDAILGRFADPWIFDDTGVTIHIFLNVSIGVILGDYIHNGESLLNLIERTLKAAKSSGKVIVYDEIMDKDFKKRLLMEMSLKKSVRGGMTGFEVHYQPIVNTMGKWTGLESLCRWNSSELGSVSPLIFIPEAERLSLIGKIGLWVAESAVQKCKELGLDRCEDFKLNVNVSSVQFSDETLAPRILKILRDNNYPGECLCVEITESTQFTFTELSLHTINMLRSKGVSIALDDFGTGYSNFNNLKKLPIDIVKIERDFISDIEENSYLQYLFHAMAELAHTAGKKLVAEGVESKSQMNLLLDSGADYLQGYLFGKPMPSVELEFRAGQFMI